MPKQSGIPAKLPRVTLQGEFQPETLNADNRTIDLVWYTGARVERFSWDGMYYLELSMDPTHVKMDRLASGRAPLLNSHSEWSLGDVLGVVESAYIQNGQGFARVRFSSRPEVAPIFEDVKDGILRNISVGLSISKLELVEENEGAPSVYRATDWEPHELSFVSVGADPNAQTLANQTAGQIDPLESLRGGLTMAKAKEKFEGAIEEAVAAAEEAVAAAEEAVAEAEEAAEIAEEAADAAEEAREIAEEAREIAEEVEDEEDSEQLCAKIKKLAKLQEKVVLKAERARIQAIHTLSAKYGLGADFIKMHVENGSKISKVRNKILSHLAAKSPNVNGVSVGMEEKDKQRAALSEAILHRADPGKYKLSDERSPYRGRSLVEMARQYFAAAGENVSGLSPLEISQLALAGRTGFAYQTTSDFPLILGNLINRRLRDEYAEVQPTWHPFCSSATAPDFKPMTVVSLGEISNFKDVTESGEYKYGSMGESAESYAVKKSGTIIALTFEAMVNDDLNAFSRIPRMLASAARRKESNTIYNILLSNPVLASGKNLFSTDHNNIAATGSGITDAALTAARLAMRTQKDGDDVYLDIHPSFLLVGPELETQALRILSNEVVPTKTADINIWRSAFDLIVEPRITGKKWFLLAAPQQIDTIEYAYLSGEEGLHTEMRNGFEVDGVEIKARLIFGASAIDYRGMYYNPGA